MDACRDVSFVLFDDLSGDGLVTLRIETRVGSLLGMGEPSTEGRTMTVRGVHLHGVGTRANAFGPALLRQLADAFLKEMDLDGLIVEGAVRTTGANPGSRSRPLRFARRSGVAR